MKALEKILDKIRPNFQKGGKYQYLHSTFDAFDTFLFVPGHVTKKGSHIRDGIDLKRTMFMVVLAVMPAMFFGMWNVGNLHFINAGETATFMETFFYGLLKVLPLIIVSYVAGLGVEFIFAQMRGHDVNEGFLVSGILIPLIVPVSTPLWMVAVATIFAVIIGKEVFGGTGMNIVNPALLARAFLFFAYPSNMSGDKVWISEQIDVTTGATPLGDLLTISDKAQLEALPSVMESFIGTIPGSVGETSTLAILLGGLFLLFTGIASWRVMFSVFAGGYLMGLIFNMVGGDNVYMALPAHMHLLIGGFAFGAVFMATDPVTAAQTNTGKYIYGLIIGIMAVLIRVVNPAYPEGMMLAILLMNIFAPTIDYYVVQANIKRRMKRLVKVVA
ncbi:MAG: NADH:ubiquinone reductase (Na(+)-transporting) subunit B [Bacteroidales bacterium]|nr:NADH:ubiquinone reductase (Na(+)-transporting) subunit B [Bacteroidales bacterium]